MATWNHGKRQEETDSQALARYTPKDLTDQQDFVQDLRAIDSNETLTALDKVRYKKQLMRAVYLAKQKEINHHLDSYENYLLARKDVESKTITLEAQKAIMTLEQQQLEMMKELGLAHSEEISNTLIKSGRMLTGKIVEIEESEMLPDIKQMTLKSVRHVWDQTNQRILESVDTYMDQLYEKERRKIR